MLSCPKCFSVNISKNGMGHTNKQHYICKECKFNFSEDNINRGKILILDIETAPIQALIWKVWQENASIDQIKEDWFILCWSAKWLNDNEVFGERVTGKEALKGNDKRIMKILWDLVDKSDIVVAHNGDNFDIPKIRTRFILNGLPPTSSFRSIDTLKIAQKQFSFSHNKLDYLAKQFGFERKLPTDFTLWSKCLQGDDKSLQYMLDYNKKDILILEEVYLALRGWTKSHPNMNMYQDQPGCSNCGSLRTKVKGEYVTQTNRYRTHVCLDCGAYSRETRKTRISVAR